MTDHGIARSLESAGAAMRSALALGTFVIEMPVPATVRAMALSGFDFVVLDLEHSLLDVAGLEPLLAEARACGIASLVRVPGDQLSTASRALDAGATGVMVPHVSSAEQAKRVVAATRFAPVGERGYSPLSMLTVLGAEPQLAANRDQFVVVQIEGVEGVRNAAEIGAVAGVDCVFVGPYDLAESLSTPGDITGQGVTDAAAAISASLPASVRLGIYMDDPALSRLWAKRGFTLQCIGFDGRMLFERATATVQTARGN